MVKMTNMNGLKAICVLFLILFSSFTYYFNSFLIHVLTNSRFHLIEFHIYLISNLVTYKQLVPCYLYTVFLTPTNSHSKRLTCTPSCSMSSSLFSKCQEYFLHKGIALFLLHIGKYRKGLNCMQKNGQYCLGKAQEENCDKTLTLRHFFPIHTHCLRVGTVCVRHTQTA